MPRYVCPECGDASDAAGDCPTDHAARRDVGSEPLLGRTVGSWRVVRLLGKGGMGRVYLAVQPQIGARVAIKVLARDAAEDRDTVERFFAEARAVNRIRHEKIVSVLDLAELPDGRPYIVMEYLEGVSLGELFRRQQPFPLGTLGRIVADVLEALDAAHAVGIVHRDLKPDNVFVTAGGTTKLLDFGIAKLVGAGDPMKGPTRTGAFLGTPAYVSPEQADSRPVDGRADQYAVGILLYQGATGSLPFRAPSLLQLLEKHLSEAPPPPRAARPDLPEALEKVILRALAKRPEDRFASAKEMAAALLDSVSGIPDKEVDSAPRRDDAGDEDLEVVPPTTPATDAIEEEVGPPAAGQTVGERPSARRDLPAPPEAPPEPPRRRRIGVALAALAFAAAGVAVVWLAGHRRGASAERKTVAAPPDARNPLTDPVPPARLLPRPGPAEAARFDPLPLFTTARAWARELYPDAELVKLTLRGVRPDGTMNLDDDGDYDFTFRSAARSGRDDEQCEIVVYLDGRGLHVKPLFESCFRPFERLPACTPAQVWERARKARKIKDAPAWMGYEEGSWRFRAEGDPAPSSIADDCDRR